MPRNINPNDIQVGGGLAANDSVESNAFVHPTQGLDGLTAHIQDPSRAHMARAIGLEDAADNFVSDHVEGALAEIAGATGAGRSNGLIEGGLFTSSVGLTFELDATTTALLNGTLHDFSGAQVTLANNTTQYVYIAPGTGLLTVTGGNPPLTVEPILIAEVTTAGGIITGSRDLRFFVYNLDRKNALIVRSAGVDANQRSEANFLTLEAALTYLELYAGTGDDPVETHRIIVRGNHDISSTVSLPVAGIQFVGDGDASFTTTAVLSPMFDLAGRNRTSFTNLRFVCGNTGSNALVSTAELNDLLVQNCQFLSGGGNWADAIAVASGAGASERVVVRNCVVLASDVGIQIERPLDCHVYQCQITNPGGGTPLLGIQMGSSTLFGEGRGSVSNCYVSGYPTGIYVDSEANSITHNIVDDAGTRGIYVVSGPNQMVDHCRVTMSSSSTLGSVAHGIHFNSANGTVSNCTIDNPRAGIGWTGAAASSGIYVDTTINNITLTNNTITGFLNESDNTGLGINIGANCEEVILTNNRIDSAQYGILTNGSNLRSKISGNTIQGVEEGIVAFGDDIILSDNTVRLDGDRGVTGINLGGDRAKVVNCTLFNPRVLWATEAPIGINVNSAVDVEIAGCHIEGFLNDNNAFGVGVNLSGTCPNLRLSDTVIRSVIIGAEIISGLSDHVRIDSCIFDVCRIAVRSGADHTHVSNCDIEMSGVDDATGALYGIQFIRGDCQVANTRISNSRRWLSGPTGEDPIGIYFSAATSDRGVVENCTVNGFYNETDDLGKGIGVVLGATRVSVSDSALTFSKYGIHVNSAVEFSASGVRITDCATGIYIVGQGTNDRHLIEGCNIDLNSSTGVEGIRLDNVANSIIRGCDIINPRAGGWGGAIPVGINLFSSGQDITIVGCRIEGFYNATDDLGYGIFSTDTSSLTLTAVTIIGAKNGVELLGFGSLTKVSDCEIREAETGIRSLVPKTIITNTLIELDTDRGLYGIQFEAAQCQVSDSDINLTRSSWTGITDIPVGVGFTSGSRGKVTGTSITGFSNRDNDTGVGVQVGTAIDGVKVIGNSIRDCFRGVELNPGCTLCVVQDNLLEDLDTGFYLEGADAGGQRCRRNTISGNTLQGMDTFGLYSLGYVHDITVSNNHFDVYVLANGVNQTAYGMLIQGTGANVPHNWVISGNEVERGRDGILILGTLSSRPFGMKVQGNLIHHVARAINTAVTSESFTAYAMGIGLNHCDDCSVTDNVVRKLGVMLSGTDVEAFPDQGAPIDDSRPVGINIWNCDKVDVQDNKILDLMSIGGGRAYGIIFHHGSSGVSGSSNWEKSGHVIQGNTIKWASGLGGTGEGDFGIWFRVDRGGDAASSDMFVRDVRINGNTIDRVRQSGIEIATGEGSTVEGLSVCDNAVSTTNLAALTPIDAGIRLSNDAINSGAGPDAGNYYHVQVCRNNIRETGANGIKFLVERDGDWVNFVVNENVINLPTRDGISFETDKGGLVAKVADWSVNGNHIYEWGQTAGTNDGISFDDDNKSTATGFDRIDIMHNVLMSSQASGNLGAAIRMQATDRAMAYINISGNQINHPDSGDLLTYFNGFGINLSITHDTALVPAGIGAVKMRDNIVYTVDDAAIRVAIDSVALGLNIEGNFAVTGGTGRPLNLAFSWPSGNLLDLQSSVVLSGNVFQGGSGSLLEITGGGKLQDSQIVNNVFRAGDEGFVLDIRDADNLSTPAVRDLLVSGNTFRNIVGSGLLLDLGAQGATVSDNLVNINVVDNLFYSVGSGGSASAFLVRTWARLLNSSFSRNQFYNCLAGVDSITLANMRIRTGANAGGVPSVENLRLDENIISACGGAGIRLDESAASVTNTSFRTLSVSRNQISDIPNTAITLALTNYNEGCYNLMVEGNQISTIDGASTSTAANGGITINGPSATPLETVRVMGNVLRTVDATQSVNAAIDIDIPDDLFHADFSNNSVDSPNGPGIKIEVDGLFIAGSLSNNSVSDSVGEGIRVDATGVDGSSALENVTVSNNSVGGNTSGAAGILVGARASTSSADLLSVTVNGNTCSDNAGHGIQVEPQGTDCNIFGVSISGNTVQNCASDGISVETSGTGAQEALSIVGNSIHNPGSSGVVVGSLVSGASIISLNVSSNTIHDPVDHGLFIAMTIIGIPSGFGTNWIISDNTFLDFGDSGLFIGMNGLQNATITGNVARSNVANHTCYNFLITGAMRTFNFANNVAQSESVANSTSMDFDTGASGDQIGTNFTGNNFRSSALGITISGSSFTPTNSTVTSNCSSNFGAGELWGNGGAGTFTSHFSTSITTNNQG